MTSEMILTYQTRLASDVDQDQILDAYSELLNKIEHCLYAETAKDKASSACKSSFLKRFGITARQFNACRVSLEGKIAAARTGQKRAFATLREKVALLDQQIQRLQKKPSKSFILHQKQRRKARLTNRLERLEQNISQNKVSLCFGGKKLFHAQFYLKENGFASHEEWKKAWQTKRTSEFFVLGSKDETAGNQTCVATLQPNGHLHLRLRLPKALEGTHGKYLEIKDIFFAYGHEAIIASLQNKQALCYRFKRDQKGWRVFVSTSLPKPEACSKEENGAIGIDINSDHIAYVETDRFGNPISKQVITWVSYGKTKNQLKALTSEVCKTIVDLAKKSQKPIVIEALDFQKKKNSLKENKTSFARLLSSFAYGLFFHCLTARAFKSGIALHRVNPAFTSIIGRVKYATRYGLSGHLAAALCIARRHQKFSEAPRSSHGIISDGKGGHVAFVLPDRNRIKHVWHFWSQVKKKLKTALAAHFRAIENRSLSPPGSTFGIASAPDCCRRNSGT